MFSQLFSAAEPPSAEGEASGVGKYVSSASRALGKGAEKAKPVVAKLGSISLSTLRKLGALGMKGLRASTGAIKSRFGGNGETPPASADGEPQDES